MKKNGFTLIELLAVIVILAIIALIATPIIMGVIENVQKNAAIRSAERYIDAVEYTVMNERLNGTVLEDGLYSVEENGNIKKDDNEFVVDVNGDIPEHGSTIVLEEGKVVAELTDNAASRTSLIVGIYKISHNENNELVAEVNS